MCLDRLYSINTMPSTKEGFKVYAEFEERLYSCIMKRGFQKPLPKRHWIEASKFSRKRRLVTDLTHEIYRAGFHVFLIIEEAKNYVTESDEVIHRVLFKDVTAFGGAARYFMRSSPKTSHHGKD